MPQSYIPPQVPKNENSRRFAIGDIHGCYDAFAKLLDKLSITKTDQIFILGDVVDRGKHSVKVLDLMLSLIAEQYTIFPIKGNHEAKLIAAYHNGFEFFEEYLDYYNSRDLLCGDLERYLHFMDNFHYYIELDQFFLSHSGIRKGVINPYTDLRGMFPNVRFQFEEAEIWKKIQVHGHIIRPIETIQQNVKNRKMRFSIDSGCYHKKRVGCGYLTALELNTMTLFHQKRGR